MTKKSYTPSQQDAARYPEEMTHWREANLVNKQYYDAIDTAVTSLPQPTVQDAIDAMLKQGNKAYFEAHTHLDSAKIVQPFKPFEGQYHDMLHLFSRLGHTPQQEQYMASVEIGFDYELNWMSSALGSIFYFEKSFGKKDKKYFVDKKQPLSPPSERHLAVYFAAGAYLQEKLYECCLPATYEEKLAHGRAYSEADTVHDSRNVKIINPSSIPYELIKLTPNEWKAITQVALGIRTPKETAYPNRMQFIQTKLEKENMAYRINPSFERAVAKHAENHPKGESFDPERFKAARAKRGLIER